MLRFSVSDCPTNSVSKAFPNTRYCLSSGESSSSPITDARALASVIGEDELSPLDKKYLEFGTAFEEEFVGQRSDENRTITETLDKGWKLLSMIPREELDRIDTKILDKYYHPAEEQ